MSFNISTLSRLEKLSEGFYTFAQNLPNGVWNTVSLNPIIANKKVQIHINNTTISNISRSVFIRQIDGSGSPIGTGIEIKIRGGSTTSVWVTTNKNAQIQIRNLGNGVVYRHINTLE